MRFWKYKSFVPVEHLEISLFFAVHIISTRPCWGVGVNNGYELLVQLVQFTQIERRHLVNLTNFVRRLKNSSPDNPSSPTGSSLRVSVFHPVLIESQSGENHCCSWQQFEPLSRHMNLMKQQLCLENALPVGQRVLHVRLLPGGRAASHWVQDPGGEVLHLAGHEGWEEQKDGVLHQHHLHPQQSGDDGIQGCHKWSFCWIYHWNFCPKGIHLDHAQIFKRNRTSLDTNIIKWEKYLSKWIRWKLDI